MEGCHHHISRDRRVVIASQREKQEERCAHAKARRWVNFPDYLLHFPPHFVGKEKFGGGWPPVRDQFVWRGVRQDRGQKIFIKVPGRPGTLSRVEGGCPRGGAGPCLSWSLPRHRFSWPCRGVWPSTGLTQAHWPKRGSGKHPLLDRWVYRPTQLTEAAGAGWRTASQATEFRRCSPPRAPTVLGEWTHQWARIESKCAKIISQHNFDGKLVVRGFLIRRVWWSWF